RSIELLEAAGCMEGVNSSLFLQARMAQYRGDMPAAVALAARGLRGYRVLGNPRDLPASLELIAECISNGRPERAAQLFGAADTLRLAIGRPLPPMDRGLFDAGVSAARAALGEAIFD